MTDPKHYGVLRAPSLLHFGSGSRASISVEAAKLGTRLGVVVDPFFRDSEDFLQVLSELESCGIRHCVYAEVVPELPLASVAAATAMLQPFEPEALLAYGGGSAIDLAKVVALNITHPGDISRFYGENRIGSAVLPVIAVPTTAGTGSEVTPVAVVSDPGRSLKVGISDPALIPRVAIVDPDLTIAAPPSVTAFSGIDALAHAVESFTSRAEEPQWSAELPVSIGANRLSDSLALDAVCALGRSLVTAYRDGENLGARADNAYGATLAGIAFGNAGVHLGHAIQYPIGAMTKTPHGMGTGLLLPHVMRECLPERTQRLAELASALGCPESGSNEARAVAGISRVTQICRDLGLPSSLRNLGIEAAQIDEIVSKSIGIDRLVRNAPFEVSPSRIESIVRAALTADEEYRP